MIYCLQNNWKIRSRGFLWDWADKESEDDLTKNYPFPIPRIRELSSELTAPCCSLHSNLVAPTKERSQSTSNNERPSSYDPTSLPTVTVIADDSNNISSDEDAEGQQKNLVHYFSDSQMQPLGYVKSIRRGNVQHGVRRSTTRRHHGTSRLRARRYLTSSVKSIVAGPPDASQEDVAKAKRKFLRTQKLEL